MAGYDIAMLGASLGTAALNALAARRRAGQEQQKEQWKAGERLRQALAVQALQNTGAFEREAVQSLDRRLGLQYQYGEIANPYVTSQIGENEAQAFAQWAAGSQNINKARQDAREVNLEQGVTTPTALYFAPELGVPSEFATVQDGLSRVTEAGIDKDRSAAAYNRAGVTLRGKQGEYTDAQRELSIARRGIVNGTGKPKDPLQYVQALSDLVDFEVITEEEGREIMRQRGLLGGTSTPDTTPPPGTPAPYRYQPQSAVQMFQNYGGALPPAVAPTATPTAAPTATPPSGKTVLTYRNGKAYDQDGVEWYGGMPKDQWDELFEDAPSTPAAAPTAPVGRSGLTPGQRAENAAQASSLVDLLYQQGVSSGRRTLDAATQDPERMGAYVAGARRQMMESGVPLRTADSLINAYGLASPSQPAAVAPTAPVGTRLGAAAQGALTRGGYGPTVERAVAEAPLPGVAPEDAARYTGLSDDQLLSAIRQGDQTAAWVLDRRLSVAGY